MFLIDCQPAGVKPNMGTRSVAVSVAVMAMAICGCAMRPQSGAANTTITSTNQATPVHRHPRANTPDLETLLNRLSLRLEPGMTMSQVLTAFRYSPTSSEFQTCGQATGSPFHCMVWDFGELSNGGPVLQVIFQAVDNEWRATSWTILH